MQQVEVLALVFVQALDMHVEERGGIDRHPAVPLDDAGKVDLVGLLDVHEIDLELGVLGELLQGAKLVEITLPAVADLGADQLAEPRIAGQQPAARGNPVGLVVDLSRVEGVKIREEIFFDQLGVQRRHSVDRWLPTTERCAMRTIWV